MAYLKGANKQAIVDYYDYTMPFYEFFWYKGAGSFAIHYGFWDKNTKNLNNALLNTNRFLAEKARIKSTDTVLDAGCGIGGSAIWLSRNLHTKVTGISISEKQINKAKELARKEHVFGSADFYVMDYLKTTFDDCSFDVVWAIESACHSENKKEFLQEAYRLLKKGGRLILADGFRGRKTQNKQDEQIIIDFNNGFTLPNLAFAGKFGKDMCDVGFKKILFWDKKKEILPTSKIMYDMCTWGYPFAKITEKLHLTSPIITKHNFNGLIQYRAFKKGLIKYMVFYGEK